MNGRVGRLDFGDDLAVRDANRYLLGATAVRGLDAGGRAELSGTFVFGREDARDEESRYDRDLLGLRLAGGYAFSARLRAILSASLLQSDYDEVFFEQEFDSPREDTLLQGSVVVQWLMTPQWLLTGNMSYAENDTDVDIFAFDRIVTSFGFNRVWR